MKVKSWNSSDRSKKRRNEYFQNFSTCRLQKLFCLDIYSKTGKE